MKIFIAFSILIFISCTENKTESEKPSGINPKEVSLFSEYSKHLDIINKSTVSSKSQYHIKITEIIDSSLQKEWKDIYNAKLELFIGASHHSFKTSTLPNHEPPSHRPADWKYSVVLATCAFPKELGKRYYTWIKGKRKSSNNPCLRFNSEVPTVNISSERIKEMKNLIDLLFDENYKNNFKYATHILLHSGHDQSKRGSAGCLTILPSQSDKFFSLIPEGAKGTLELIRGLHDSDTQSSFCY